MQAEILKKDNLIPIRAVSYDIGALLLTILKGNNIMIDESFTSIPFSESIIKNTIEEEISIELIMTKEINDYNLKTEKTIYNTINNNNIIVDELCELVGVNFYNAVYYKNYIISKYFVMYDDKILYGDFLIETKEYKKITKIYKI